MPLAPVGAADPVGAAAEGAEAMPRSKGAVADMIADARGPEAMPRSARGPEAM